MCLKAFWKEYVKTNQKYILIKNISMLWGQGDGILIFFFDPHK